MSPQPNELELQLGAEFGKHIAVALAGCRENYGNAIRIMRLAFDAELAARPRRDALLLIVNQLRGELHILQRRHAGGYELDLRALREQVEALAAALGAP